MSTALVEPTQEAKLAEARRRLEDDDAFYFENCLHIVDQNEQLVRLRLKPAQRRLLAIKARQEAEGKPVRIIVDKARKEGISTAVQGLMIKRLTQRRNHKALVIAHDSKTSGEIFAMGETMYSQLPTENIAGLEIKPSVVASRKGQEIRLGEPSRARRLGGEMGLNSSYLVDTANEYQGGRGFTYHSLHMSELAWYQAPEKKLRALLNAVPDTPGTMIVVESTPNGYNLFRRMWVAAVSGRSEYFALFIAWYEDPDYQRAFADPDERVRFIQTIGHGDWGEDEPALVALGVTPEQLHWRRWAIENKCQGDLRTFWQEYPANWEEGFLATGRQVFASVLVSKVLAATETSELLSERGSIEPQEWEKVAYMGHPLDIPAKPLWTPEVERTKRGVAARLWQRWEAPDPGLEAADPAAARPPGQYVIFVDSASGKETASEGSDYFAVQVINHYTLAQVAQWHERDVDADEVCRQVYLAALLYSTLAGGRLWRPWIGVEVTGGYGVSIATTLWRVFKYPMLYFRRPAELKGEKQERRLGWSTDGKTKPLIVDHAKGLLSSGRHGIRSKALAGEMQTFVRDDKGKMGAEEDYFDDLLDAWMGAQYIASEKPLRRAPSKEASAPRSKLRAPTMNVRPHTLR